MNKSRIHIESMTIRLPRSIKRDPRRVAGDVGREVLTHLAEAFHGRTGAQRVDAVSARLSADELKSSPGRSIEAGVVKEASRRSTR